MADLVYSRLRVSCLLPVEYVVPAVLKAAEAVRGRHKQIAALETVFNHPWILFPGNAPVCPRRGRRGVRGRGEDVAARGRHV